MEKNKKKIMKIALSVFILAIAATMITGIMYTYYLLNLMEREHLTGNDDNLGIKDDDFSYDDDLVDTDIIDKDKDKEDKDEKLPFYFEGVTGIKNIVIFGIDAEDGTAGRSDAIIIVTIDSNSDKIKLTSIVRDSYVNIPGRGMDKINHAYAFGGPQLAIQTLNSNFHLDIRDYVAVNFTSMPKIVNKLGGIELTLTEQEANQISGISGAGKHVLNGEQALSFSRIRSIDSDIERGRRQRDVLEACINKMLNTSVGKYPGLLREIFPLLRTNMSSSYVLSTGTNAVVNNIRTVEQKRFPDSSVAKGQLINGIYYYVFNRNSTVHAMGKYIYLDKE